LQQQTSAKSKLGVRLRRTTKLVKPRGKFMWGWGTGHIEEKGEYCMPSFSSSLETPIQTALSDRISLQNTKAVCPTHKKTAVWTLSKPPLLISCVTGNPVKSN